MQAKYFIFCRYFLQYKHHKEEGDPSTQIEGKETDDWLCIDFGKYLWIYKYEVLHELFVEGRVSPWTLVAVERLQSSAALEFQLLLLELIEILNTFSVKIIGTEKKQ